MNPSSQEYLHTLAKKLHVDPRTGRDILLELQGHLEDRCQELQERGVSYQEALQQAVQELGDPKGIAQALYSVHSKGSWREISMATLPHLFLAGLFALHLWTSLTLLIVALVVATFVSVRGWKRGKPKWTYPWLGYCMAAPALSWLLALAALGYGAWQYVTTGSLPFSLPIYLLLLAYIPFSLWITANVIFRIIRQDWLLASLTALPFPFLTSWLLLLNWRGGLWASDRAAMQETDGDRALVFLALAITTAVFFKAGHRLVQIALLTLATAVLVAFTTLSLPLAGGLLAAILFVLASLAFLLTPALLESRLGNREPWPPPAHIAGGEVITQWFASAR